MSARDNLPVATTSFIGREAEMTEVRALLGKHRLVTLTGPGGAGKTRIALEVAASSLRDHRDGVWLAELAPIADPANVAQTVATALGVREEAGRSLSESLGAHLAERETFLVLDNCEHVLEVCASLAASLLEAAPGLRILVTSRAPLGVEEERTWPVPTLAAAESVRLFVDRAAAYEPQFALAAGNAKAVAQICSTLEGIPLAIELAAARVRTLSPIEIAARLEDRFGLLTSPEPGLSSRRQTLQGAVDWSYDLLTQDERAAFGRAAVFAGGFTAAAATTVCGASADVLSALADRSLLIAEGSRYRMLETIRRYALGRLASSGEETAARDAHADYLTSLAEEAEPELSGANQQAWMDRLEAEHGNIRAALDWTTGSRPRPEVALRLAAALWRFWLLRGYWTEGRTWLARALEFKDDSMLWTRAKALDGAGVLAGYQNDEAGALALYKESLTLWRALADEGGVAVVLNHIGIAEHLAGNNESAHTHFSEALEIHRARGDAHAIARVLNNLGSVAQAEGDHAAAVSMFEEAFATGHAVGDRRDIATWTANIATSSRALGKLERARSLHLDALAIRAEITDRWGIVDSLEGVAAVLVSAPSGPSPAEAERAAVLLGAASVLREQIGFPITPGARAEYDAWLALARSAAGDASFAAALSRGRSLSSEEAITVAAQAAP
jgi:non-specific serine/threonine protein kinase